MRNGLQRSKWLCTFDTMFLHCSNLLEGETESIYHEDGFGNVDAIQLAILKCEYE